MTLKIERFRFTSLGPEIESTKLKPRFLGCLYGQQKVIGTFWETVRPPKRGIILKKP